jgi:hypothetical protein
MAATDRRVISFADDEDGQLNATWSPSSKRLVVTVGKRGDRAQVELTPAQVRQFGRFLADAPA